MNKCDIQLLENIYYSIISEVKESRANIEKLMSKYGVDQNTAVNILNRFNKVQIRLTNKDIFGFDSAQSLIDAIQEIEKTPSKASQIHTIKDEGSRSIYKDGVCEVKLITTADAAIKYGSHTKWCISAKQGNLFDIYNKNNHIFIVLFESGLKYAILSTKYIDSFADDISKEIYSKSNLINTLGEFSSKPRVNSVWTAADDKIELEEMEEPLPKTAMAAILATPALTKLIKFNLDFSDNKVSIYSTTANNMPYDFWSLHYIPDEEAQYTVNRNGPCLLIEFSDGIEYVIELLTDPDDPDRPDRYIGLYRTPLEQESGAEYYAYVDYLEHTMTDRKMSYTDLVRGNVKAGNIIKKIILTKVW